MLALGFNFATQRLFDASSLLQVALFELFPRTVVETESGIAHNGFGFVSHTLSQDTIALTQSVALLRIHLQPALGVSPECLLFFRRKTENAFRAVAKLLTALLEILPARMVTFPWILRKNASGSEDRQRDERAYKDEVSSHRLFSSEANKSSRSVTTS